MSYLLKKEGINLAIAILVVILVVFSVRILVVKITGVSSPIVVVKGISMLPTLYYGDLVVIHKVDPFDIKVGDIIVYKSEYRGELVIHRVIKIVKGPQCNPVCYITKGDNNVLSDAGSLQPINGISYDKVLGVVYTIEVDINGRSMEAPLRIPYIGLFVLMFR
ncbi:hypothetical protein PYJP_03680 [Pyrofollis japonicus]|uniref:signal peptidase I n=1 Tax=Pyrofollis japonicus TaxID=3060460 RepID=UPI00295BECFD|nr:signal peptidase I [Pyrofollis japonicus]BEP17016.1 hypothetical protein PYJP_03680 [Pyrofollis japonicus]